MDWYKIISTILWVLFGFLVTYFKQKAAVMEHAKFAINHAEQEYASAVKAGQIKFEYAVNLVEGFIPAPLKPFISREFISDVVQKSFDAMQSYANKQLDKVVDKVVK